MSKFFAGVITTFVIMYVIYAFKTRDIGDLGLAFFYFSGMCLVYGINFGVWLEKETPSKRN